MLERVQEVGGIIGIVFPVLVAFVLNRLRPVIESDAGGQLPKGSDAVPAGDQSPSQHEHLSIGGTYLLFSFVLAVPLAWLQWHAFHLESESSQWLFSWRVTDGWLYPMLPGLFLGLVVGFWVHWHFLRRYQPKKFWYHLDRRYKSQPSLRQNLQAWPWITWVLAVGLVVLNWACFDTFLQIGTDRIRYSSFFSPSSYEHPIDEISRVIVYSLRQAPNGDINEKTYLELELKGGQVVDTYYLMEPEHIPVVVDLLSAVSDSRVLVERRRGPK